MVNFIICTIDDDNVLSLMDYLMIVGSIENTRDNVLNRAQELQEQAKAKTDELRQKVEEYLRNTNKEELNPDAIKREFQVLLDDPQAGISLLRDRLSQFDRDTLVAVISSRQDISQAQANKIIDQIEASRDRVLHQAERIQKETQRRLNAIKELGKKQAEETKKTVASAAWWLFGTALTSLAASAIAGAIAVSGIPFIG